MTKQFKELNRDELLQKFFPQFSMYAGEGFIYDETLESIFYEIANYDLENIRCADFDLICMKNHDDSEELDISVTIDCNGTAFTLSLIDHHIDECIFEDGLTLCKDADPKVKAQVLLEWFEMIFNEYFVPSIEMYKLQKEQDKDWEMSM